MILPYTRALAEIDAVMGINPYSASKVTPFIVPNNILGLDLGSDPELYTTKRDDTRRLLIEIAGACFIDIFEIKSVTSKFVQNGYQNFLIQLKSTEHSEVATARAIKAFTIYLMHNYCNRVLQHFYSLSRYIHIFFVANALRNFYGIFPEDELIFDCCRSHGLELATFSLGLSLQRDKFQPSENACDLSNTILRIPSTEDIAGMIKFALRKYKVHSQLHYDFNDSSPEAFLKQYLESITREHSMKTGRASNLNRFREPEMEVLKGLLLLKNVITIEIAIELSRVPIRSWLRLLKHVKVNFLLWRNNKVVYDTLSEYEKKVKKEEEHKLNNVENMLRSVAAKIKFLDYSLYKTYSYKLDTVTKYLHAYYKGFFGLCDELSIEKGQDNSFDLILDIINYLFNCNIKVGIHVYEDSSTFQLLSSTRLDRSLVSNDKLYNERYFQSVIPERAEDPGLIKVILNSLPKGWSNDRLSALSAIGELPLSKLFAKLYRIYSNDELRKGFITYQALAEGKTQIECDEITNECFDEKFYLLTPSINAHKLEQIVEEKLNIREKLRVRKLQLALMSLLSNIPIMQNKEITKNQKQLFFEKTYEHMTYIKGERQTIANKLLIAKHVRIKLEMDSEVNLLKLLIQSQFLQRGIDIIKQEQILISDLLEKGFSLIEFPLDGMKGISAVIYENLELNQRKSIKNVLSCIRTFATQIKNRATYFESDTFGTSLIITLKDFNNTIYNLCRNNWRLQIAQEQAQVWNERRYQQECHDNFYNWETKSQEIVQHKMKLKKLFGDVIDIEVTQRSSSQICEIGKRFQQSQYWMNRISMISNKLKHKMAKDIKDEIKAKDLELAKLRDKFLAYKETVANQLKHEIMDNSDAFIAKVKRYSEQYEGPYKLQNMVISISDKPQDANGQLRNVHETMKKLRVFYNLCLCLKKRVYERRTGDLKDTIIENNRCHVKLSLAERKEFVLKQELVYTQERMVGLEHALKVMQNTLKEKNEVLMRSNQKRHIKARYLTELEAKLKSYANSGKEDPIMAQKELEEKTKEVDELRELHKKSKQEMEVLKESFDGQLKTLKQKLSIKEEEKNAAILKVKQLQEDLAQAKEKEVNEEDEKMWQEKCKELLDLCKSLRDKNEAFRAMKTHNQSTIQVRRKSHPRKVNTASTNSSRGIKRQNKSIHVIGVNHAITTKSQVRSEIVSPKGERQRGGRRRTAAIDRRILLQNERPMTQENSFFEIHRKYNKVTPKVSNITQYSGLPTSY